MMLWLKRPNCTGHGPRVAFQVFHDGVLTLRSVTPAHGLDRAEWFCHGGSGSRIDVARVCHPGAQPDVWVLVAEQIGARRSILGR